MKLGWVSRLAKRAWLLSLLVHCFAQEQTIFPPRGEWSFRFENHANRESVAYFGEELVDEQRWASEQLGLISMKQVDGPPQRIVFEYELEDLTHREQDRGGDLEWSMDLERNKTEMFFGSRLRENPLGDIIADPFDDFVAKSRAFFHHDGSAYREDGQLHPADYLLASGDVGQQVFGGLKVEEWAHRLVVPVLVGLKEQGALSRGVPGWVQRGEAMPELVEHWSMSEFTRGWRVKMNCEDVLPRTSIDGLSHQVDDWRFTRRLEAWLDASTFLPLEISIVEEGGYGEGISLGKGYGLGDLLKVEHRWKNTFKAVRDEG